MRRFPSTLPPFSTVVTSDFHVHRSATIFSCVYGSTTALLFVSSVTDAEDLEQLQLRERLLLNRWWPAARRFYSQELLDAGADTAGMPTMDDIHPSVRDCLAGLEVQAELSSAQKAEMLWEIIERSEPKMRDCWQGLKHGDIEEPSS